MPENAWSLLVFTLLSQMSVGAFCVAEFLNFFHTKEFGTKSLHFFRLYSRLLVLASVVMAGISAIFHLRKWENAYQAFNNFRNSWLSKEMVFFLLFMFCVALLALMTWRKIDRKHIQRVFVASGLFCGIALVYSMAKIYMLPTVPVWNAWTTPGLFFAATLLLGSLAVACLFQAFLWSPRSSFLTEGIRERWIRKTLPNLIKMSMFFLVIGIMTSVFFAHRLMAVDAAAAPETPIMDTDKQVLFFSRIFFFVLGWIFQALSLKKLRFEEEIREKFSGLLYGAFVSIAFGEILGRYLFYVSFFRIGL
jgi:anaerobic dimethyl sulfoxide reductase subunit C (anchor subunit)